MVLESLLRLVSSLQFHKAIFLFCFKGNLNWIYSINVKSLTSKLELFFLLLLPIAVFISAKPDFLELIQEPTLYFIVPRLWPSYQDALLTPDNLIQGACLIINPKTWRFTPKM